jgi:hypothetical protein
MALETNFDMSDGMTLQTKSVFTVRHHFESSIVAPALLPFGVACSLTSTITYCLYDSPGRTMSFG